MVLSRQKKQFVSENLTDLQIYTRLFSELTVYTAVVWEWHKHSLFNLFAGLIDLITSKAENCCQKDSEMEIYYLMLWNMVVL